MKVGSRKTRAVDGDSMDSESLLSTSSNLEPFASDDLGKHCSSAYLTTHQPTSYFLIPLINSAVVTTVTSFI